MEFESSKALDGTLDGMVKYRPLVLRARPMAGQLTLDQSIEVRILCPQPADQSQKKPSREVFCFFGGNGSNLTLPCSMARLRVPLLQLEFHHPLLKDALAAVAFVDQFFGELCFDGHLVPQALQVEIPDRRSLAGI